MRNEKLPAALMWKFGALPNKLTCLDGKIENWPEDLLGPKPSISEQAKILADYLARPPEPVHKTIEERLSACEAALGLSQP